MARIAFHVRSTGALVAIAAALLPAVANAEEFDGTQRSAATWSKTSAILGGAPSALQAILAQQGGAIAPAALPVASAALRTASYSRSAVPFRQAPLHARDDAGNGRPDVFGTVALKVGRTKLDERWHRASNAAVSGVARDYARSLRTLAEGEQIERVNHYVNRAVDFVDDSRQFGRADVWSNAADTLRRGKGDCEDYAIAKLQMLREAGFSAHDLYLVILNDLVRRTDHAVLVVRTGDRFVLLDNGTDDVVDSNSVEDYRPILSYSADGAWTHGYRVNRKPVVTFASAEKPSDAAPPTAVLAFADQRSRSASPLAFNTGLSK